ncbi:hypothetical protein SLS56_010901 [Neofusicoccum ribis]|uniref:Uncharacterized protein n=1 Tax=Neofusicoccum ribis TaxID=45134 RepID=A0ABR3SD64_9PEZI
MSAFQGANGGFPSPGNWSCVQATTDIAHVYMRDQLRGCTDFVVYTHESGPGRFDHMAILWAYGDNCSSRMVMCHNDFTRYGAEFGLFMDVRAVYWSRRHWPMYVGLDQFATMPWAQGGPKLAMRRGLAVRRKAASRAAKDVHTLLLIDGIMNRHIDNDITRGICTFANNHLGAYCLPGQSFYVYTIACGRNNSPKIRACLLCLTDDTHDSAKMVAVTGEKDSIIMALSALDRIAHYLARA